MITRARALRLPGLAHLAVALILISGAAPASAQIQLPDPVGYVNDFADVIPAEHEARIQRIIGEVRAKSGGEIVVVTLPSLEGRTRDEVALQIGREWGIGARGEAGDPSRNTGAVVLVVPKETSPTGRGEIKIELGSNTSRFITAAEAGRIRDGYMIPAFRSGDYGRGIADGVAALAAEYAEGMGFELTGEFQPPPAQGEARNPQGDRWIFWMIVAFVIFMSLRRGRRGRRRGFPLFIPFPMGGRSHHHRGGFGGFGGGGGGFGGGFGGFGGGGGFSGGGAGGSW